LEHEARRIKLYNSFGKPVTPAFSQNPVLKAIERMKKLTDEVELAMRKKEMAAALAAKGQEGAAAAAEAAGGAAAAGGGAGAGGGVAKAARVRPEAEVFDSHMDFKVKKSGAMERGALGLLLVDLGWAKSGDPKKDAKILDTVSAAGLRTVFVCLFVCHVFYFFLFSMARQ
jgi:hypothetical protein